MEMGQNVGTAIGIKKTIGFLGVAAEDKMNILQKVYYFFDRLAKRRLV